jgi:kinesin family protein 4/21/27
LEDKVLQIREDDKKGVFIPGLSERPVNSAKELANALIEVTNVSCPTNTIQQGSLSRTTGSTLMNTESSRSHAVFTITIQQTPVGAAGNNLFCKP